MKQLVVFAALAAILLAQPAYAASLEYYDIKANITPEGSVEHVMTLVFKEAVNEFTFNTNLQVENISAESTFPFADCSPRAEGIYCDLIGVNETKNTLKLKFSTPDAVIVEDSNTRFTFDYGIPFDISRAFVFFRLPKDRLLGRDIVNESFFPQSGSTTLTEGKRVAVFWELDNITESDRLKFSALYTSPQGADTDTDFLFIATIILLAALAVAAISVFFHFKGRRGRAEVIASVLSPDENKVVEILKSRGGKSLQKALVRETDFSKAKVSRLVKELKSRKVIEIEPVSGRENRIILRTSPEQKPEAKDASPAGQEAK